MNNELIGASRQRSGLREALAAARADGTLVVATLDRLARSLPDARDVADESTHRRVALKLGVGAYDPNDPVGRLLLNVLGMVAEFARDLIRTRARKRMAAAKAKSCLRGKKPKLSATHEKHLANLSEPGGHTTAALAELLGEARSTVHRGIERAERTPRARPPRTRTAPCHGGPQDIVEEQDVSRFAVGRPLTQTDRK